MFFQRRQEPSILSLCFPNSYKCNGCVLLSENSISFMVVQKVKNLPCNDIKKGKKIQLELHQMISAVSKRY